MTQEDEQFPPEPEGEAAEILHAQGDVTPAQLKALAVVMRKHGMDDREVAKSFLSWLFDRPLESSKELLKSEASRVIGWSDDQWESALVDFALFKGGPEEDAA